MSLWTMIFLVVIAGMVFAAWKTNNDRKHGITRDWMGNEKLNGPDDDAEKRMLQSEVEELRERVKVLERIATDPATRTAREIENLRDETASRSRED